MERSWENDRGVGFARRERRRHCLFSLTRDKEKIRISAALPEASVFFSTRNTIAFQPRGQRKFSTIERPRTTPLSPDVWLERSLNDSRLRWFVPGGAMRRLSFFWLDELSSLVDRCVLCFSFGHDVTRAFGRGGFRDRSNF